MLWGDRNCGVSPGALVLGAVGGADKKASTSPELLGEATEQGGRRSKEVMDAERGEAATKASLTGSKQQGWEG